MWDTAFVGGSRQERILKKEQGEMVAAVAVKPWSEERKIHGALPDAVGESVTRYLEFMRGTHGTCSSEALVEFAERLAVGLTSMHYDSSMQGGRSDVCNAIRALAGPLDASGLIKAEALDFVIRTVYDTVQASVYGRLID